MTIRRFWLLVAAVAIAGCAAGAELPFRDVSALPDCAVADIENGLAAQSWWVRIGDRVYSPAADRDAKVDPDVAHYYIVAGRTLPDVLACARVGGIDDHSILLLPEGPPPGWGPEAWRGPRAPSAEVGPPQPLKPGAEFLVPWRASGKSIAFGIPNDQVQALVDQVNVTRVMDDVRMLAAFQSRNTRSATVDDARDAIAAEMRDIGLTVTITEFWAAGPTAWNVIGELPGWKHPEELVVVGGHYDSMPNPPAAAPGAEDNASGTAGVLEIARIMVQTNPQRTIQFVAFGAEELGR